ncbi:hypothetical protein BV22DRAFT_1053851 [Leucogyrophana mollusca]|uniref:Uncharacterized protein n=1 Tax=Leucogyrophana mollusca TaxID=85980 RepID=A0ACB8BYQ1_9AGAM|nr:hypothetical protein BV22DRAFT_1053851 [Leucogyrophana mollusca]
MLRGVGRVCSQHIKQAPLIPAGRHEPVLSLHSVHHHSFRTSCPCQAAGVSHAHSHRQVSSVHGNTVPHASSGSTRNISPRENRTHIGKGCKSSGTLIRTQYPPELVDAIDAFPSPEMNDAVQEGLRQITNSPILFGYFSNRETARKLAEDMALTQCPQRAHQVLTVAHKLGCRFKPSHYESVAHQLAQGKRWADIPALVSLGKHQCGRTSIRMLNWKARAFAECRRYDQLRDTLEEFAHENLHPTRRTFHILLSGYLLNRDLNLAKDAMERMAGAGFPVDASTHAVIVSAYRSLGLDPEVQMRAFNALHDVDGRASTAVLNSIIQQFLDANDRHGASRFLKAFGQASRPPKPGESVTIDIDNHSSSSVLNPQQSTRSTQVSYVRPDAATYTMLMNYMAKQRDLHGVLVTLNRMKVAGVKPDHGIAAALIRAYCFTGHEGAAVNLVAQMCHSDTTAHYLPSSLRVPQQHALPLETEGIQLTAEHFNVLMDGILRIRGLPGARVVLRAMCLNGIRPDEVTVQILMDYLDRAECARPRELIRLLRYLTSHTLSPTLQHIHIILRSIMRREKFLIYGSGWDVTAAKYSSKRQDLSLFPEGRVSFTRTTFEPTAGLRAPRRLRYDSWLRPIVRSLSRRNIKSDRRTIALRMRHEAVSKSELVTAKDVFRRMVAQGMHPTIFHYTALMDGYAKQGDLQSAEDVMQAAKQAGLEPNVVMYTIIIAGHGRQGDPDNAMRTFQRMISAGITPDVPAIDAVAHAYFAVGAYNVAKRTLVALWSQIRPFPEELAVAPLETLARVFRSYPENRTYSNKKLSKQEKRLLRWKLLGVLRAWERQKTWVEKERERDGHCETAATL